MSQALTVLSELEERFAHEYAVCLNATQAYLRCKPNVTRTTASTEGSKLLGKPWVGARVVELRAELEKGIIVSAQERRRLLEMIARADHLDIWEPGPGGKMTLRPLDEIPPEARLALQEIAVVPTKDGVRRHAKLYSRVEAIDLLNKMDGLYVTKHQHEGEIWHKVVAVPLKQPTRDEWIENFSPGRQVQAKVVSIEVNGEQA